MHRLARYGVFFVVGVMLLVWLSALSLTHSVEEVQLHSRSTVRLAEQQCNQHIGPFAKQDTAWSRWREARGQGQAVSVGIDTCYDASGTKVYCFSYYPVEGRCGSSASPLGLKVDDPLMPKQPNKRARQEAANRIEYFSCCGCCRSAAIAKRPGERLSGGGD